MQTRLLKRNDKKNMRKFLKNNAYPLFKLFKSSYHAGLKPGGDHNQKPQFDFINDSKEDLYNDIRIVLIKMWRI